MKFGIYLGRIVKLVDCESGEIVACGSKTVMSIWKKLEKEITHCSWFSTWQKY